MKKLTLSLALAACIAFTSKAQLIVTPDTNTVQLVNDFILSGVTASNVQYTGAFFTLGSFSDGSTTNLGMYDGIVMTTGTLDTNMNPGIGSPVSEFASYSNSWAGDTLLDDLIPGFFTYDASVLEFDLIPVGNVLEFQYVFGSEEYPEYVGSSFNDVFGFFINGANPSGGNYADQNIAIIPGTGYPVSINNVNAGLNAVYFVDNEALGGTTIVFDGFTTVLTAMIDVIPSATYHLKLAIADAGDGVFDSGIFLKANSMKSYTTTGINTNLTATSTVSVYPNPVLDHLTVVTVQGLVIEILNIQGQIIKRVSANDKTTTIDISDLPGGIYMIKTITDKGTEVKRVVKK